MQHCFADRTTWAFSTTLCIACLYTAAAQVPDSGGVCRYCCVTVASGETYSCVITTDGFLSTPQTKVYVPIERELPERVKEYKGPSLSYRIVEYVGRVERASDGKVYDEFLGFGGVGLLQDDDGTLGITDGRHVFWAIGGPIAPFGAGIGYEYSPEDAAKRNLEAVCARDTWIRCEREVTRELDARDISVERATRLATIWNAAFHARLDHFARHGFITRVNKGLEYIEAFVEVELEQSVVARQPAHENLLRQQLSGLTTFMAKAAPLLGGVHTFFEELRICDVGELQKANELLINRVQRILEPSLVPGWRQRYDGAVRRAEPHIRRDIFGPRPD